jgi:hypothetical protein
LCISRHSRAAPSATAAIPSATAAAPTCYSGLSRPSPGFSTGTAGTRSLPKQGRLPTGGPVRASLAADPA